MTPTVHAIQQAVAQFYGLPVRMMTAQDRAPAAAHARQAAMFLARHVTKQSYPSIGRAFRRDHSTIIHGVQAVEQRIHNDPVTRRALLTVGAMFGEVE